MLSFVPLCHWSNMMALPLSPLSPSQTDPLQPLRENICIDRCLIKVKSDQFPFFGEDIGILFVVVFRIIFASQVGPLGLLGVMNLSFIPWLSRAIVTPRHWSVIIWKRLGGNLLNDPLETVNHPAWELTLVTECETRTAENSHNKYTIWGRKGRYNCTCTTFIVGNPGLLFALLWQNIFGKKSWATGNQSV